MKRFQPTGIKNHYSYTEYEKYKIVNQIYFMLEMNLVREMEMNLVHDNKRKLKRTTGNLNGCKS